MSKIRVYLKNEVRIMYIDSLDISKEAISIHKPTLFSAKILNDAIATFSSFCWLKPIGSLSVYVKGNGAVGTIIFEVKDGTEVRATISNYKIEVEKSVTDINNVPIVLGIGDFGILKIVNEIEGHHFGSEVSLVRGDLVTDLVYYFHQSEQINTAIILDTEINNETKQATKSRSLVFQLMPSHTEKDIEWIEDFIKNNKLKELDTIDKVEKAIDAKFLEEKEIQWKCRCSDEKMKDAVSALSDSEKEEIIREFGFIEVTCDFCGRKYKIYKN